MRLFVKLHGDLHKYLDDDRSLLSLADGSTLQDLLARLGIPAREPRLTWVNRRPVEESAVLSDGDQVDISSPIGGGASI